MRLKLRVNLTIGQTATKAWQFPKLFKVKAYILPHVNPESSGLWLAFGQLHGRLDLAALRAS